MGRRLLGVVDAQVADDTRGIPHAYTVVMHPADRAAFSDVEPDLIRELTEAVTQHSERESYRLAEPVIVVLRSDENTKRGNIAVDGDGMTSIPGVFAGGDAVSGPDTVVHAKALGRRALALSGGSVSRYTRSRPAALMVSTTASLWRAASTRVGSRRDRAG